MRLAEYGVILDASDNPMLIGRPDHDKVLTPAIQIHSYFALMQTDLHYNIAYR